MKLCFFMDSIYSLGGAQRCTITLANEMVNKGYDVTIICTVKVPIDIRVHHNIDKRVKIVLLEWHNILNSILTAWTKIFVFINNRTEILKNNKRILKYIYYTKNTKAMKRVENFFDSNNFDCVIGVSAIHTMILSLLNKKENTKFIGWQHSSTDRYFRMKEQFFWHQDILMKDALNILDHYVVLTKNDKEKLCKLFNSTKIINIPNPNSFHCNENIIRKRNKTIISVGRYNIVKGYDLLIEAFSIFHKSNPDYELKIVGDGTERDNLEKLIKNFDLEGFVILTGVLDNVKKEYLDSDFYVMSSRQEGFPVVLIEAMECGLPIVTFDLPCVHEILNDQCGYVVEYMNIEALADAMLKLASIQDKKNIRNACHEQANKFKVENIIKEWEKIL